ncbi:uncharacterized protein RJT20DRAFT_5503 [Scheffersomyces xylosifermentans]|uniref:uncharacterized protein n=1 Tax=Scheffersomyces xylosifermentans TaxID=1304137 RepID=UPI00315DBF77
MIDFNSTKETISTGGYEESIFGDLVRRLDGQPASQPNHHELQRQHELERQREIRQRELRKRQQDLAEYQALCKPSDIQHIETNSSYQIHVFKKYGDFSTYQIRIVKRPGCYFLKMHSEVDDFEKSFQLNQDTIDINTISWKWQKSKNTLIVNLPKQTNYTKEERKRLKKKHQQEKNLKNKQKKLEKKLKKKAMKESAQQEKAEAKKKKAEQLDLQRQQRELLKQQFQQFQQEQLAQSISAISPLPRSPEPTELPRGGSPVFLNPIIHSDSSSDGESAYETPSETDTDDRDPAVTVPSEITLPVSPMPSYKPTVEDIEDDEFELYKISVAKLLS